MAYLTIGVLKQIIENVPDDYIVEYVPNDKRASEPLIDIVQINITDKKLIFK